MPEKDTRSLPERLRGIIDDLERYAVECRNDRPITALCIREAHIELLEAISAFESMQ